MRCFRCRPDPVSAFVVALGLSLIASGSLLSCSSGGNNQNRARTFFPLAVGNRWVFQLQGSGSNGPIDSMWINFDSVQTAGGVQKHWYRLKFGQFLDRGIYVRRDSLGDLWASDNNLEAEGPFMLFSKVHGETWPFTRFCPFPDTLRVTDTSLIIPSPDGALVQNVRKIEAAVGCLTGVWGVSFAPNTGPVVLEERRGTWNLLKYKATDDEMEIRLPMPRRIVNPE